MTPMIIKVATGMKKKNDSISSAFQTPDRNQIMVCHVIVFDMKDAELQK